MDPVTFSTSGRAFDDTFLPAREIGFLTEGKSEKYITPVRQSLNMYFIRFPPRLIRQPASTDSLWNFNFPLHFHCTRNADEAFIELLSSSMQPRRVYF